MKIPEIGIRIVIKMLHLMEKLSQVFKRVSSVMWSKIYVWMQCLLSAPSYQNSKVVLKTHLKEFTFSQFDTNFDRAECLRYVMHVKQSPAGFTCVKVATKLTKACSMFILISQSFILAEN